MQTSHIGIKFGCQCVALAARRPPLPNPASPLARTPSWVDEQELYQGKVPPTFGVGLPRSSSLSTTISFPYHITNHHRFGTPFGLGLHPYIATHTLHEPSSTFHHSTLLVSNMHTSLAVLAGLSMLLQGVLTAPGALPISIRASDDNTCGPNFDNKVCDGGQCCSNDGVCVSPCLPPWSCR
jgi:hypothetical protein